MESVNAAEYQIMTKKNHRFTVFSSYNQAIISVAQTLLNEAGIKYFIVGSGIKESVNSSRHVELYSGITELQVTGDENIMAARKILLDLEELDFQHKGFKVL